MKNETSSSPTRRYGRLNCHCFFFLPFHCSIFFALSLSSPPSINTFYLSIELSSPIGSSSLSHLCTSSRIFFPKRRVHVCVASASSPCCLLQQQHPSFKLTFMSLLRSSR